MKTSTYQKDKKLEEKKKAFTLYKQGLTTREVSKIMGKSHTWVANVVNELSPENLTRVSNALE